MKTLNIILTVLSFTVLIGLARWSTYEGVLFQIIGYLWAVLVVFGLYCFWREITKNLKEGE